MCFSMRKATLSEPREVKEKSVWNRNLERLAYILLFLRFSNLLSLYFSFFFLFASCLSLLFSVLSFSKKRLVVIGVNCLVYRRGRQNLGLRVIL